MSAVGQTQKKTGRLRAGAGAAVALSLAAHVAVLSVFGLAVQKLKLIEAPTRAVEVILLPPSLSRRPEAQPPAPAAAPAKAQSAPASASPAPAPFRPRAPRPPPRAPAAAPPSALQGALPAAPGPAPPTAPPGKPAGEGRPDGVTDALRSSVGCDVEDEAIVRLTQQERARCHQAFGAQARKGEQVFGIDPLKRKRFDAQADEDERRRQNRTGPLPGAIKDCAETADAVGASNLGGGCLTSHTTVRPN